MSDRYAIASNGVAYHVLDGERALASCASGTHEENRRDAERIARLLNAECPRCAGREFLDDELNALRMTVEEGQELHDEMACAFSGLAGELLKPCSSPCPGHFRERGQALYKRGLDRYAALVEGLHVDPLDAPGWRPVTESGGAFSEPQCGKPAVYLPGIYNGESGPTDAEIRQAVIDAGLAPTSAAWHRWADEVSEALNIAPPDGIAAEMEVDDGE